MGGGEGGGGGVGGSGGLTPKKPSVWGKLRGHEVRKFLVAAKLPAVVTEVVSERSFTG